MILNETANQPLIFIILIIAGFASGLIYDLSNLIVFLCNKNKVVQFFCDFISTVIIFLVFILTNINYNYGTLRLYTLIFFLCFLTLERITLGKLIAKTQNWCYTKFVLITRKIRNIKFKRRKKNEQKTEIKN